jgi:hypothetical protein
MTPLTMMRWDWDDNPRTGGDAGCGCGAAAGVLLVESLEELGPEIMFEGALAAYTGSNFELRLFYAIPRRAAETSYIEYTSTGADPAEYSLETYGFEGLMQVYSSWTDSFLRAAIHLTGSWENRRSVDYRGLGYPVPYPWHESAMVSVSCEVPVIPLIEIFGKWLVIPSVGIRGECLAYNRAQEHWPTGIFDDKDSVSRGGGMAGLVFEAPWFSGKADYLRLKPEFYSPFAALSYEPNTEGVRFSSRLLLPYDYTAFSFFYKRLWELDVPRPDAEEECISFFGASLDIDHPGGIGGGIGWLDKGIWRSGTVLHHDEYRRALSLSARYRFGKGSYFQLQYQKVRSSMTDRWYTTWKSETDLYSAYFTLVF